MVFHLDIQPSCSPSANLMANKLHLVRQERDVGTMLKAEWEIDWNFINVTCFRKAFPSLRVRSCTRNEAMLWRNHNQFKILRLRRFGLPWIYNSQFTNFSQPFATYPQLLSYSSISNFPMLFTLSHSRSISPWVCCNDEKLAFHRINELTARSDHLDFLPQVRIEIQMCLRFATKYLHLVLIETFVWAELKLGRAIVEVHIGDGVADVFAKVARLGTLEGRPTPQWKAIFRAEERARISDSFCWICADVLMTPRAAVACVCGW